ncbi:ATP synthase F1 subunit gamma [Pasteuria penetrans]|uniref:ATP synthase F1 subunit gamma n=1 Tax=Pasteuria penetrans TaxID=86005 RepID=UPI000FB2E7AC|nr:ATP synthase F1 subunit gamma [Pasteuria penetrans]
MPANTRELKRRVRSVRNTQQITKAMKMVAASKLRHAQDRVEAVRPYNVALCGVLSRVLLAHSSAEHPLIAPREVQRRAYCVITSDRGLAGGYNSGLLRKLEMELQGQGVSQYYLIVSGRKGAEILPQRGYTLHDVVDPMSDMPAFLVVRELAKRLIEGYVNGTYDELLLVFNRFISPMVQDPTVESLLPLAHLLRSADEGETTEDKAILYDYEPSVAGVLDDLLVRVARAQVYQAVLEARASEFAARMHAMSQATDNAEDMISSLTLQLNRARQAAITQEIAEIVGGAAAL